MKTLSWWTVWKVLLTLVIGVGSPERAALGPRTRASLASLGLITMRQWGCPILDHPVKESRGRVSIGSETRPDYVQSIYVPGMLIRNRRYVQWKICSSDEWQIGPHEEWTTWQICFNTSRCIYHSVGWIWLIWTEGWPSHSGTLECAWPWRLSCRDGTMSWVSTAERTPLSGFLLVCLYRLLLLSCPWQPPGPSSPLRQATQLVTSNILQSKTCLT